MDEVPARHRAFGEHAAERGVQQRGQLLVGAGDRAALRRLIETQRIDNAIAREGIDHQTTRERVRELAAKWRIDVPLSNHPGYDGTVAKLKARAANPAGSNPFVSGQSVVERAMQVLNTCARAQKNRFLLADSDRAGKSFASISQTGPWEVSSHEDDDHVTAHYFARSYSDAARVSRRVFPFGMLWSNSEDVH